MWVGPPWWALRGSSDVRCGDDDLCVNKVLVELGVLALLVGRGDELVALLLNPLPDAELVLSRSEKLGLLLGVDATLDAQLSETCYQAKSSNGKTYIVEDKKNFSLL